ncbi:hypothetical protein VE03_03808 [Pseudogymnoascus sp. 23342-1-I1]|nr:hypothetical protein VE03_03808 [Pseudogymnoascus sp. 23342-1-I1]
MAPNTDISTRALIVTLKSPFGGKTTAEVAEKTGLSSRQVNKIYARAIERGFDPNHTPLTLRDEWLQDAPRTGRPLKQTTIAQDEVIAKLTRCRHFLYNNMEDSKDCWIPENETDKEAWIDEEDESREVKMVS